MAKKTVGGALVDLEHLARSYDDSVAAEKSTLLGNLRDRALGTADEVVRLHEVLCFLRAYPDNRKILSQVEKMLSSFSGRRDLGRHRDELDSSGIAGSSISYRFYWFTALWLARHWPERLHIEWEDFGHQDLLNARLTVLMAYSETLALEEAWLPLRQWLRRLRGPNETNATFVVRRFAELPATPFWREQIFEELDVPFRLDPGPTTPSRTRAHYRASPVVYQDGPLETSRSSFPAALRRPPKAVRLASRRQAGYLITLAREAMVSRSRDLDAFIHADPADVRVLDCGRGLQFVCYGPIPERRQMLDSVYGFLILKNGVPIGYFLTSALYRSALVAYNIFDTYRGAEAAYVYGRGLAMVRHVFGADSFGIETYQLGDDNPEALESGAWWFYYKLGFRPRDPEVLRLVGAEVRKIKKNPHHRSTIATLRKLSAVEMYLHLGRRRDDIVGLIARENVGFRISRYLAARFGGDRKRGLRVCATEAAALLGVRSRSGFSAGERLAWERWAPLVLILPRLGSWSKASKKSLVEIMRAKGGRRESEFVELFDRHRTLRRSILGLARDDGE